MTQFYDETKRAIETAIAELARDNMFSPSKDYGEYRERAGQVQGLQMALNIAGDVINKLMKR